VAFNPERWRRGDGAPYQLFTFRVLDADGLYGEFVPTVLDPTLVHIAQRRTTG